VGGSYCEASSSAHPIPIIERSMNMYHIQCPRDFYKVLYVDPLTNSICLGYKLTKYHEYKSCDLRVVWIEDKESITGFLMGLFKIFCPIYFFGLKKPYKTWGRSRFNVYLNPDIAPDFIEYITIDTNDLVLYYFLLRSAVR